MSVGVARAPHPEVCAGIATVILEYIRGTYTQVFWVEQPAGAGTLRAATLRHCRTPSIPQSRASAPPGERFVRPQVVVRESDEPHAPVDLWLCDCRSLSSFPVAEQALNVYVVTEVESPQLAANTQRITLDCYVVARYVE